MTKGQSILGTIITNSSLFVLLSTFFLASLLSCSSQELNRNELEFVRYFDSIKSKEQFNNRFFQLIRESVCTVIIGSDKGQPVRARIWFSMLNGDIAIDSMVSEQKEQIEANKDRIVKYLEMCNNLYKKFGIVEISGINGKDKYIGFKFGNGRKLVFSEEQSFPTMSQNAKMQVISTRFQRWVLLIEKN